MQNRPRLLVLASLATASLLLSIGLSAEAGWQTFQDRGGVCQLSVPQQWSIRTVRGHASSPEHLDTTVIEGRVTFRKFHFSAGMLKALNVDKVFGNSAERVFYVGKSSGTPPALKYHVEVPGHTHVCIAQISTTPAYPQGEVKKIAATLAPVK